MMRILAADDYVEVSKGAYGFRSSPAYSSLKRAVSDHPQEQIWREIRHYMGRLASWTKSTRFIIDMLGTEDMPGKSIRVMPVRMQRGLPAAVKPDTMPPAVLSAVLSRHGCPRSLHDHILNEERWSDMFARRWQSIAQGTRVHAEVAMLHHFQHRGLSFARDEPYVGCSKPSCYCCSMYMSAHCVKTRPRPSHNNVWVQWAPAMGCVHAWPESVVQDPAFLHLCADLKQQIRRALAKGNSIQLTRQLFDSATDLSDSLPSTGVLPGRSCQRLQRPLQVLATTAA